MKPEIIDVIPWGISHDVFRPAVDVQAVRRYVAAKFEVGNPYFLSVSCNAERKRSDSLVRSYIELNRFSPARHDLVMVWANPPAELVGEIRKSGLASRIHLITGVPEEDLVTLYQGAVAAFNPSSYEGFGLPVLEAMACGVPAVTCWNSSLPEVGGEVAIYVGEPIERSLVEVMLRFERGEVDGATLGCKGVERAAKFTWENVAKRTVASYLAALNMAS